MRGTTKRQRRDAVQRPLPRNPLVRLTLRSQTHAGTEVLADTRRKIMRPGKGAGSYVRSRLKAD